MGVWILACERRCISGRCFSPPAKVTFWISDKTLFPCLHCPPPQALRISQRGESETRGKRASDRWRSARDHGKEEEVGAKPFLAHNFRPERDVWVRARPKDLKLWIDWFSRWLKGIRNQSPQSVGTTRCSTSNRGKERHEICYERYFS